MDASSARAVTACASVPGGRSENQDRCYVTPLDPSRSLWGFSGIIVVADGMGGHEKGEVAAQLAVDTATEILAAVPEDHGKFDPDFLGAEPEDVVRRVFELANERVYERAGEDELRGNMGTTMTAVVVVGSEVVVGHVGDSKAFVISGDAIEQITEDHSWVAEQVKEGLMTPEQAADSPLRGHLTQAIGVETEVLPYTRRVSIEPGAMLLVCSDGLTDVLDADAIHHAAAAEEAPEPVCQTLVSMAVDGGARDNVTVGVMVVGPPSADAVDPAASAASEADHEGASAPDGEETPGGAESTEEPVSPPPTADGEGERTVGGQRSHRLAVLAATCMLSLLAGLVVGKLLIGARGGAAPQTGDTTTELQPTATPRSAGQPEAPPAQPAGASGEPDEPLVGGGTLTINVKCEDDLLIVAANERMTYDVYPRGQHANFDSRLLPLEGAPAGETRFRLPEAPPDSWHEESMSLTIERLGDRKITIEPIPEDLELYVDHEARSGDQLESLELAGQHARIGLYFPPSRPENAYAIAIADFDAGTDEEADEAD